MKVLQINTVYGTGSVGRICMELYEISEQNGIEAYMAYGRGQLHPEINGYKIGSARDFTEHVLWNFFRGESGFHSTMLTKAFLIYLDEIDPDVIHLHNIHGFYLQTELLFEYLKKKNKKVIWTLHDCWPFTGHCAYFDYIACEKWKTGCKDCIIHARAYPYALFCDSTARIYPRKKEAYCGVRNLTIVTPSNWLAGLVKQSFLKEYRIKVIPNGIDLTKFRPDIPIPDSLLKTGLFGTEAEAKKSGQTGEGAVERTPYILGVANVWEHRKGLTFFERMAEENQRLYKETGSVPFRIVLVGLKPKQLRSLRRKYDSHVLYAMQRTQSTEELACLYANAAVYVNATLEDNFPTTNLEALACGTPVITFQTGGSAESVDKTCGCVVTKGDYTTLKMTVARVVVTSPFSSDDCRRRAKKYNKEDRFMEYIRLYRS